MSSIFSTSAGGVGTQITSLPGWPEYGSNSGTAWANAVSGTQSQASIFRII
jgi:hypothetical protein